jgi:hypothetical protein
VAGGDAIDREFERRRRALQDEFFAARAELASDVAAVATACAREHPLAWLGGGVAAGLVGAATTSAASRRTLGGLVRVASGALRLLPRLVRPSEPAPAGTRFQKPRRAARTKHGRRRALRRSVAKAGPCDRARAPRRRRSRPGRRNHDRLIIGISLLVVGVALPPAGERERIGSSSSRSCSRCRATRRSGSCSAALVAAVGLAKALR